MRRELSQAVHLLLLACRFCRLLGPRISWNKLRNRPCQFWRLTRLVKLGRHRNYEWIAKEYLSFGMAQWG
jgi:hypothetical protein